MRVELKLDGIEQAGEKIRALPDLLRRHLLAAFVESAAELAKEASRRAPKETGELAGSMEIKVQERGEMFSVTVGPKAFYAPFVEFGHKITKRGERARARLMRKFAAAKLGPDARKDVPAKRFFFPAVEALRTDYSARIAAAIRQAEEESSSP